MVPCTHRAHRQQWSGWGDAWPWGLREGSEMETVELQVLGAVSMAS